MGLTYGVPKALIGSVIAAAAIAGGTGSVEDPAGLPEASPLAVAGECCASGI